MAKMEHHLNPDLGSRTAAKARRREAGLGLRRMVPVLVAVLLLAAGFLVMKYYVDELQFQLGQIRGEAAALNRQAEQVRTVLGEYRAQLDELKEKFAGIESEMRAVKEQLSLAGDTLESADETKQTLSQRIADLGKELDALKKLIAKLEEAARVY